MRIPNVCGWLLVLLLLPLRITAGEARFTEESAAVVSVFKLIDERLSLMPDVAAWKYRNKAPIADPKREQAVVDRAVLLSEPLGIPGDAVRSLFELQVRLARDVQSRLHQQWGKQGFDASHPLPSLDTELRPRLDRLTFDLLRALYIAAPALQRPDFVSTYTALASQAMRTQGWTDANRREVLAALSRIRLAPAPVLERARASGVLRIGTTGDYAPFSLQSGDSLWGADIELVQSLAQRIDAHPIFVRTSWSTLIEDLRQNKFDLVIGGVSVTAAREAVGAFSVPYTSGGKTIIARCKDAPAYNGLPAIDRRGVRVIVNPGGTNEQYVREHVRSAEVQVFPDNRLIFDEIRAGRADVMVTDDVEVELQTRRHADLCRAFPGTLTHADKAIFMPHDENWVAEVNNWLVAELGEGRPARLIEQFLQPGR